MNQNQNELELYDAPAHGPDYVLKFTIKNGPLMRALKIRGYHSLAGFARAAGLSVHSVHEYAALKRAPIKNNGKWTDAALAMARALRLPPESLFPEQHLERALKRNSGELEFSLADLQTIAPPQSPRDPEQLLIEQQDTDELYAAITQRLEPRVARVLDLYFGLHDKAHTIEQIADMFDVGRVRIQQLIWRAEAKLRNDRRLRAQFFRKRRPYEQPLPARHYKSIWKLEAEREARHVKNLQWWADYIHHRAAQIASRMATAAAEHELKERRSISKWWFEQEQKTIREREHQRAETARQLYEQRRNFTYWQGGRPRLARLLPSGRIEYVDANVTVNVVNPFEPRPHRRT